MRLSQSDAPQWKPAILAGDTARTKRGHPIFPIFHSPDADEDFSFALSQPYVHSHHSEKSPRNSPCV